MHITNFDGKTFGDFILPSEEDCLKNDVLLKIYLFAFCDKDKDEKIENYINRLKFSYISLMTINKSINSFVSKQSIMLKIFKENFGEGCFQDGEDFLLLKEHVFHSSALLSIDRNNGETKYCDALYSLASRFETLPSLCSLSLCEDCVENEDDEGSTEEGKGSNRTLAFFVECLKNNESTLLIDRLSSLQLELIDPMVSLDGIENFPSLQELQITGSGAFSIKNIDAIQHSLALKTLQIECHEEFSLSSVLKNKQLEILLLRNDDHFALRNQEELKISCFKELTNLKILELCGKHGIDFDEKFPASLQRLDLSFCGIDEEKGEACYNALPDNLEYLNIEGNSYYSIAQEEKTEKHLLEERRKFTILYTLFPDLMPDVNIYFLKNLGSVDQKIFTTLTELISSISSKKIIPGLEDSHEENSGVEEMSEDDAENSFEEDLDFDVEGLSEEPADFSQELKENTENSLNEDIDIDIDRSEPSDEPKDSSEDEMNPLKRKMEDLFKDENEVKRRRF